MKFLRPLLALFIFLQLAHAEKPPNIVFMFSDDHALEATGCYESWISEHAETPNIDRIASEGMRFLNYCCNNSICSPSRASFVTGQYSHKNGVTKLNGAINITSSKYPALLGANNYQTGLFGKWHLKTVPDFYQHYEVVKGQGSYFDPTFISRDGSEKTTGYSSDIYTDHALDWLAKRDEDKPFLMCLQFKAPHHDYSYPERYDDLYADLTFPEPPTLHEDCKKTSPRMRAPYWGRMAYNRAYYGRHWKDTKPPMRDVKDHSDLREVASAAYQHMMLKYLRCVKAVDDNIGRVLDVLEKEGLEQNTLVVYTSDQGYWLGQHGFYDKRLILEGSLRMPFVARLPGKIKAGSVCEKICNNTDWAPTVLDYAGIEIPKAMQGHSLRPLLEGAEPDDWRKATWYSYWGGVPNHWGVRTEDHTYIRYPGTDEVELYDLKNDREQVRNVADDPAYASARAACETTLQQLMVEVDISVDELPEKEQRAKHIIAPWTPDGGNPDEKRKQREKREREQQKNQKKAS